jgi:hypothetical protein
MQTLLSPAETTARYAQCVEASRRVRWDIDRDLLRGRQFAFTHKFLPDGLSRGRDLAFLQPDELRLFGQVQGRTYANLFGLVERFIAAVTLQAAREHSLGNQVALEALVRFADEEIKHQELFRRIDRMLAAGMPAGYRLVADPDAVAQLVLARSPWAVLGLICHIELFVPVHYRESIAPDPGLCPLWKDVFLFHWREESQHAVLDELEWLRCDAKCGFAARDRGVDDLIALVTAVDGILQAQAAADAEWFLRIVGRPFGTGEQGAIRATFLSAYRWQYIGSGLQGRFMDLLARLTTDAQMQRLQDALAPLVG